MIQEEKINYMRIATNIVGYSFDKKTLDMFLSLYDLINDTNGQADLKSVAKVQSEVCERDNQRINDNLKKLKQNV
jgi:hypothetical protein